MKTLLTLCLTLLSLTSLSAQKNLETQSIALENLITFIANQFPLKAVDETTNTSVAAVTTKQISFILETSKSNYSSEDKIILQQAFKFLTTRLLKEDKVSIYVYAGQNGQLLDRVSAKDIKKMMSVINNVKSSIIEPHKDGIAMAYNKAQTHYKSGMQNLVVMVRNPNASVDLPETQEIAVTTATQKPEKNKGNNVVLLTAITLLPELISLIKD